MVSGTIPELHEVLEAAGEELAALGRMMEALQNTLTPGQAGTADLQVLDSVTQHLFALSRLLGALAPGWNGQIAAALEAVSLGALQCRLRRQPAPAISDPSGEFELFGNG